MRLAIGIWPQVETTRAWPQVEALLLPAAIAGGEVIEVGAGWHVWTVHDGPSLIGAANVRRCDGRTVDVVLVGGRDCRRWIGALDERIGDWAWREGADALTARGRAGWGPILARRGWRAAPAGRAVHYERRLD